MEILGGIMKNISIGQNLARATSLLFALKFSSITAMELPRPTIVGEEKQQRKINEDIILNSSIKNIYEYINKLLISGVSPESILLVLDVDGTLTNYSNPNDHIGQPAEPRGDSVQFVKDMVNKGVKVVVSSAWKVQEASGSFDDREGFRQTLRRLRDLKLDEVLKLDTNTQPKCGAQSIFRISVGYCHLGLVASVGSDYFDYYRRKAFAFKYVYPDLDLDTIKYVIFADDSEENIAEFRKDILRIGLGKVNEVSVTLFQLTSIKGGSD